MALASNIKSERAKKIEQYEGRFNHLYLDTKGKVTIGIGHLIPNRNAIATIMLYKLKNKTSYQLASLVEKQTEYDKISKLSDGQRYGANTFKIHTSLMMKNSDINLQRDKQINNFYKELTSIYQKCNGYPEDFDNLHKNVQLSLFDMIFNLGATKIVSKFPNFNTALKASDWKKAATESNRPDVNAARNAYVKQLLNTVPVTTNF